MKIKIYKLNPTRWDYIIAWIKNEEIFKLSVKQNNKIERKLKELRNVFEGLQKI